MTDIRERAIIKFGLQLKAGKYERTTQRCLAFLKSLYMYYSSGHEEKAKNGGRKLITDFIERFEVICNYVKACSPPSPAILNLMEALEEEISEQSQILLPRKGDSLHELTSHMVEFIKDLIYNRIIGAQMSMSKLGKELINDGEVILTYKNDHSIGDLFITAKKENKNFSVVIIDSAPGFEGRKLVQKLSDAGIKHSYSDLSGLPYVLESVTKTFLGAESMYSNGSMMAEAGSSIVAFTSKKKMIPVVAFSETFKFSK